MKNLKIFFSIFTFLGFCIIDNGFGKFLFLIAAAIAYMFSYTITWHQDQERINANRLDGYISDLREESKKHQETLLRKRSILLRKGDYNELIDKHWHDEIINFANITIGNSSTLYIYDNHSRGEKAIISTVDMVVDEYERSKPHHPEENIDVELLSGIDYEKYCFRLLQKHGWSVRDTSITGDQGVDLIAKKGDLKIAIQCKRFSSPVGNGAVQEVHAGLSYWEADKGIVVSNAGYTKSAKELANKLSIILIHHDEIPFLDKKISAEMQRT